MQEVNDSLLAECARWNYRTPASWVTDANAIRTSLFPARTSELFGQWRTAGLYPSFDPPSLNQFGGSVTNGYQPQLTAAAGTIYYTLDGSDPRLAGGGVSPAALIWGPGAVTITSNVTFNTRVFNAGQWSALSQPAFFVAGRRQPTSRDLLITEIQYNPDGSDEYEFVELYNASTSPLDLSGVSLSNAVRFIFPNNTTLPPGAFVMVVENTNQFAARYQTPASLYYWPGLRVAGEWVGALDNAGENLLLLASNGTMLASVDYQSGGEWPGRADGSGSSLELRTLPPGTASDADVRAFVSEGPNWSSSALYHGSPGRLDAFVKSVRVNEVLSHSLLGEDSIELFNAGTQSVSLANCTLTDNLSLPNRYAFAGSTVIAPGQFLVLSATQLGFAFGEFGDSAALLQLNGTNIIRFLDTVDFPAAPAEEPFGVYQRMDGDSDFTELTGVTAGAANAAPRVGPAVISEIHFNPPAGFAEFVEITSVTNVPVPLYDPAFFTNVWTLEGVGSFAFPTGAVLAPFASVIVCATNPAAFRAQYGVSASVPVFGPWTGALDGNGETLKLLRPGPPQTNGLPLYRVDHVSYRTHAPWPPLAPGLSLQKSTLNGYGNDSVHWTAAPPTPGTNLPAGQRPVILAQPQGLSINEGQTALFSVVATGAPPVSFQWRFRSTPLTGATNATLVLTNVQISVVGLYDVVVFGAGGSTVSTPATLIVIKPPVITLQPVSQTARPTSNVVFTVAATGNGTLRYQWRLNGVPLGGSILSTHTIPSAGAEHAGTYTVLVSDDLGSILSVPATLTMLIDPVIVQQPLSQTMLTNGTVTLSVSVSNTATLPLLFRWRRGGFTFTNFYTNSYVSFLTLSNVQAPNTNWSVFITNAAKFAGITSSNAQLTLLMDTNANGLPDPWETAYGFTPGSPGLRDADPDQDGLTNWQEYIAGTDPTNAASVLRVFIPMAGGGAQVSFGASSNRTYSVYFTDLLEGGVWTKLADILARSSNHVEIIPDPGWTTNRYYRAVVSRQP